MAKKKVELDPKNSAVEAYEKLLEAIKSNGNGETAKNVKRSLDDWRKLQKLFGRKGTSIKEIAENWKNLQSSSSRSFRSLAALITAGDSNSDSSTSSSPKKTSKGSSSSSSFSGSENGSNSDDTDSDTGPSAKEGHGGTEAVCAVNDSKLTSTTKTTTKAKSDSSSSSSGSKSGSDTDTGSDTDSSDSCRASDGSKSKLKRKTKATKPMSSSPSSSSLDSDGGPDSGAESTSSSPGSEPSSASDSEKEAPPTKKRKIESGKAAVKATNSTESRAMSPCDKPVIESVHNTSTKAGAARALKPTTSAPIANKARKSEKQPRGSNTPFQRIKVDAVTFSDGRLKDNSYRAHVGKASDYGAKANADLIVTRGDGFRKEKNKKKRGSYRGGEITLETRSIKFS